ncbi:MotE family protein [Dongia sp.]|uniref:MotE family protein n=1 Tax=Dongia sp. TaxID=1977262 RepID=UPI0035B2BCB0
MPSNRPTDPTPATKSAAPRVRLLPVLAGVMTLVLTIRVGDMYRHVTVGIGTETQAQSAPASTAEPPAAAPAGETPASETPAGENAAATEPASTAAPPPARDPLEYTDEEVEVLQQLAKRREELELKSRQLDEREAMVAAAEQRMEQKMAELKALQSTVEDLLKKRSDEEESSLQMLVATYEKMKPKEAAQVFEELDMDLLVDLVSRMKTARSAPILALVSPTKVKELTFELAQQKTLPLAP